MSEFHHETFVDFSNITFIVCMVYLDSAPAMDSGTPSRFDELCDGVSKTKVVEMIIKDDRLHEDQQCNVVRWKSFCQIFFRTSKPREKTLSF